MLVKELKKQFASAQYKYEYQPDAFRGPMDRVTQPFTVPEFEVRENAKQ
ncbi:MAG: hypothetical protein HKN47_05770 [Pirellulaceae bacterium]|nr:hypothetical protein [Pirellulaceae bacterium]